MKCAVIYYSNSGNTKKIAMVIKVRLKADMYFVEPAKPYGSFVPAVARVVKEKLTKNSPAARTKPADFSGYDIVFIGFPVWAGTMPEFMQSYIRSCDLSNKKIIPFATAGGTGEETSLETVKALLPDCDISDYLFVSNVKKPDVGAWLADIAEKYRIKQPADSHE